MLSEKSNQRAHQEGRQRGGGDSGHKGSVELGFYNSAMMVRKLHMETNYNYSIISPLILVGKSNRQKGVCNVE